HSGLASSIRRIGSRRARARAVIAKAVPEWSGRDGSGLLVQRKRKRPSASNGTNQPYEYWEFVAQSTLRALITSSQHKTKVNRLKFVPSWANPRLATSIISDR